MLPCPSTSTISASLLPCRTRRSAAPATKSATTASTAIPQPSAPLLGKPPAQGRDADQDRGRLQGQTRSNRTDHGDPASEPKHVLHRLALLMPVEDSYRPLGEIANHRVSGLRSHWAEVAIG